MNNKEMGNSGEGLAVKYLEQNGYSIIDTNVRPFAGMRRGEIDIVAWDGDVICIIEVKTRRSSRFDAFDAITVSKRRQLTRLAQAYITRYNLVQKECRFDVVVVYDNEDIPEPIVQLSRHAFDPVY